ncbi:MAG: hypothetical protein JKY10_09760 [Cohaesibacteraceae bacterium]|nr:hypothetical protein [Cohaesibacteraceae bacterium]MBL4876760.1 hypothetical protein [Cohaesibacteraceae bacterium]
MHQDCFALALQYRSRLTATSVLFISAILVGLMTPQGMVLAVGAFIAGSWLSFGIYATLLPLRSGDPGSLFFKFLVFQVWVFCVIFFMSIVATSFAFFPVMVLISIIAGQPETGFDGSLILLILFVIVSGAMLFVIPLFATMLPAHIVAADSGYGPAMKRGRAEHWNIVRHLAKGPGFLVLIFVAVGYVSLQVSVSGFLLAGPLMQILKFFTLTGSVLLACYGTVLTAWVFCRAFQITMEVPEEENIDPE